MVGIPTILTIENDAITVANIFPRKLGGALFINILIHTPIVVPPTNPAQNRSTSSRLKLDVQVVKSVSRPSSAVLIIKNRFLLK